MCVWPQILLAGDSEECDNNFLAEDTQPVTGVGFLSSYYPPGPAFISFSSPLGHLQTFAGPFWGSFLPLPGIILKGFSHENLSCDTYAHNQRHEYTRSHTHIYSAWENWKCLFKSKVFMLAWLVPAEPQAVTAVTATNKAQICWHGSGVKWLHGTSPVMLHRPCGP